MIDIKIHKKGEIGSCIICFHGFGQTHEVFDPYFETLSNYHRCYSLDLPFHGASEWPKKPINDAEIEQWFLGLCQKEKITNPTIIAYSLGGRYACSLAANKKLAISELILLAPDGCYNDPWQTFASSRLIKPIFRHLMDELAHFEKLIDALTKLSIISSAKAKFVLNSMKDEINRKRIYQSWSKLRNLPKQTPKPSDLPETTIFLAEKDPVTNNQKIKRWANNQQNIKITEINCTHHQLLANAMYPVIRTLIKA